MAGSPNSLARSKPRASGRLEITTAIFAASIPLPTFASMASKLDPRPDRRMPRLVINDALVFQFFHQADNVPTLSQVFEDASGHQALSLRHRQDHPDA